LPRDIWTLSESACVSHERSGRLGGLAERGCVRCESIKLHDCRKTDDNGRLLDILSRYQYIFGKTESGPYLAKHWHLE